MEISNCDTCQCTKQSYKKYGKSPDKSAEEIPRNKIYVYLIGTYVIIRKGNEEKLHLKAVTMIDPVTGCFEIAQYDDKNRYLSQN